MVYDDSMSYNRIPDSFPVLRGEGLTLRELTEEDLPAWFARLTDTDAATLAGAPVANAMQDVVDALQHHRTGFRAKEGLAGLSYPMSLGPASAA